MIWDIDALPEIKGSPFVSQRETVRKPRVARDELPWVGYLNHREPRSGFYPMPQSLSSVYLHIVFSTKERMPFLSDPRIREEVHAFLGGVAKSRDCPPLLVGGMADHVHALVQLGRTVSQADLVKELKRASSVWIHERFPQLGAFAWQAGYAAFSVSVSNLDSVRAYIAKQEEHHAKISFQDEFRQFLEKHRLEYDERFVWN